MKITQEGYKELIATVQSLEEERVGVLERLELARSYGDLKENSEYKEARNRINEIDTEVMRLNGIVANAIILQPIIKPEKVVLGAFAVVEDMVTHKTVKYQLVENIESNFNLNKLSIHSPFGQKLMNKKVGDIFEHSTQFRTISYKIIEIS